MKRNSLYVFVFLLLLSSTFSGCKKESVCGCNDVDAINYNPLAEEYDGSCIYEGEVDFWYGEAYAEYLRSEGVTHFYIYIDGKAKIIGSPSMYWVAEPGCGGGLVSIIDMGYEKARSKYFWMVDQNGIIRYMGSIVYKANQCTPQEFILLKN
jgi:hypothetical protein